MATGSSRTPPTEELTVDLPAGNFTIRINNLSGQTVKSSKVYGGSQHRVDTRNLSPGVYQLIIEGEGFTGAYKVIK